MAFDLQRAALVGAPGNSWDSVLANQRGTGGSCLHDYSRHGDTRLRKSNDGSDGVVQSNNGCIYSATRVIVHRLKIRQRRGWKWQQPHYFNDGGDEPAPSTINYTDLVGP